MSTKIISYDRLGLYDENIKNVIITQASTALALARKYTDDKIDEVAEIDTSNIYTKPEVDAALSDKSDANHNHDEKYDTLGSANKALEDANIYTDSKISDLVSTTALDSKISTHNTSTSAHNDIRTLISDLTIKLNNFLDVDDATKDQLSEVITLIENNKGTLESLTTSKVNVSDIIDNLTTANSTKVLAAKQGVVLKELIDALQDELDEHTHAIADVSGLQSALDGKAASSHGTHVSYSSTAPVMDGTASVGSASTVARSDHKHPTDTTRASQSDLTSHTGNKSNPHGVTKSQVGLGNVENKSSATIRGELTKENVTNALGYTPPTTNTTYSTATTSANGLMSSTDKTKLEATNIAYGTCSTDAATVAKVITISGNTNWKLAAGSMITVKFTATNTAQNPTFNVNNTGAKSVWYNTALITTGNLGYAGTANRPMNFVYDGTQYVFIGWSYDSNSTYSNASLGQGYGTCSTAAATTAKVVTLSNYALTTGGIVSVKFTYDVPASATMNINSKGAKSIYYRGAAITAGVIGAGDTATFIYNGSQYHLLTVDKQNSNAVNEIISTTEPSGQNTGDYWLMDY